MLIVQINNIKINLEKSTNKYYAKSLDGRRLEESDRLYPLMNWAMKTFDFVTPSTKARKLKQ